MDRVGPFDVDSLAATYGATAFSDWQNANPGAGVEGSIPPVEAVTHLMEEVVYAIEQSGQTPDHTNPHQLAQAIRTGFPYGVTGGTAQAATVALAPTFSSWANAVGKPFLLSITNPNTAPVPTLSVTGLTGAKSIVRSDGSPLNPGDLTGLMLFAYDGTSIRALGLRAGVLTRLTTALTVYVNPVTGNDTTGDGLTSGTAWATLNKAWSWLQQNIDAAGQQITISCYNSGANTAYAAFHPVGGITGVFSPDQVLVLGDVTNRYCRIALTGGTGLIALEASSGAQLKVTGFYVGSTGSGGGGLNVNTGAYVKYDKISFGQCGANACAASGPGSIAESVQSGAVSFLGNCGAALNANNAGQNIVRPSTVTFGGITVSGGTAVATNGGIVVAAVVTFAGSGVSGPRFACAMNGLLDTNGSQTSVSAAYMPGSTDGTTTKGGQFQ